MSQNPKLKSTTHSFQDEDPAAQGLFDLAQTGAGRAAFLGERGSLPVGSKESAGRSTTDNPREGSELIGKGPKSGGGPLNTELRHLRGAYLDSKVLRNDTFYANVIADNDTSVVTALAPTWDATGIDGSGTDFDPFVALPYSGKGLILYPNPADVADPENAIPRRVESFTSTRINFFASELAATSVGPLVPGTEAGVVRFTVGIVGETKAERDGDSRSFNHVAQEIDPAGNIVHEAAMGEMVASATTTVAGDTPPKRNYTTVAMEYLRSLLNTPDRDGNPAPNGTDNENPGVSSAPMQSASHTFAVRFDDLDLIAQGANVPNYSSTLSTGATADGGVIGKNNNRMVCVGSDVHSGEGTLSAWSDARAGNVVEILGQYGDDDDHSGAMVMILCDPEGNFYDEVFSVAQLLGGLTSDGNGRHVLDRTWEHGLPDPTMPYSWIQYVSADHITG